MNEDKRTENIRGEVIDYDQETNSIVLKLHDEIDIQAIQKLKVNGRYYTYLDFYDKRNISDAQRNYFWALMGDYATYTGHLEQSTAEMFKMAFMKEYDMPDFPSVGRNGMTVTTARKFLQFILEYFIEKGIPFQDQQFYLAEDEGRLYYALTMNRICWVCGEKHSDLHHAYGRVGAGRDRNKFDHTKSWFEMLCRKHHNQAHNMGQKEFDEYYKFKPIKLDVNSLKELNVQGNYES